MRLKTLVLHAVACAVVTAMVAGVSAQSPTNPRYGRWKNKNNAPAPASNIMIYEPHMGTGMKITIESVNAKGEASKWGYTTMFDGKDEPLYGNAGTDTGSVRVVSDSVNEIIYKKGGKVTQILTNVLSPDHDTIGVMYMRMNDAGKVENITVATYERMK
jgi:hypothetical protein